MPTTELASVFPVYTAFDPAVPVRCVTVGMPGCIHRFYDSSPFSPSGRFLAVTRLPAEDRPPLPGESATVLVIDLPRGETVFQTQTRGWDTQVGAQPQWGADDHAIFFNDLNPETWIPYGVRADPLTGKRVDLGGTICHVSSDGSRAVSPCLRRTARTQAGYGVRVPPEYLPKNGLAPEDDGVWVTDTETGRTRLLLSIRALLERARPPIRNVDVVAYYCMHTRWNRDASRIQLVLRGERPGGGFLPQLLTISADGTEVHTTVPAARWACGGNHPSWAPDGERILMNLAPGRGAPRRFFTCRFDGSEGRALTTVPANRGHPTLHPSGRYILTDAYPDEALAFGDGSAPVWLIDCRAHEKRMLARMPAAPAFTGERNELRLDLHPAWDRAGARIAFNGLFEDRRAVFIADLPPAD